MGTFRPSVKANDDYIQKIIKYIPAEIMAGYVALTGSLTVATDAEIPHYYSTYYLIVFFSLFAITPIWTYYATLDNANAEDPVSPKTRARFHAVIATLAFLVWVYAIGNPILKVIICHCEGEKCPDCLLYSTILGSIILILFTIITPLIERIVLGTKLPKSLRIPKKDNQYSQH